MDAQNFKDWLEICELKARYCRFTDTKDWDGLRSIFTEDYELDCSGEADLPEMKGREVVLSQIIPILERVVSAHHVHAPEIVIDGDTATGVWSMRDRIVYPADWDGVRSFTGLGHYHERYVRQDGRWLIAYAKLTRLHIDYDDARLPALATAAE